MSRSSGRTGRTGVPRPENPPDPEAPMTPPTPVNPPAGQVPTYGSPRTPPAIPPQASQEARPSFARDEQTAEQPAIAPQASVAEPLEDVERGG